MGKSVSHQYLKRILSATVELRHQVFPCSQDVEENVTALSIVARGSHQLALLVNVWHCGKSSAWCHPDRCARSTDADYSQNSAGARNARGGIPAGNFKLKYSSSRKMHSNLLSEGIFSISYEDRLMELQNVMLKSGFMLSNFSLHSFTTNYIYFLPWCPIQCQKKYI